MLDAFTLLSNAQVVTTTAVSTNSIPLSGSSSRLRDIGAGQPLAVRFHVGTAFANGTSIDFEVILSSSNALNANLLVLATSGAVAVADLTAGAFFDVPIPPVAKTLGDGALRQFLGARYTCSGTFSGGGSVTASVVPAGSAVNRKLVTSTGFPS